MSGKSYEVLFYNGYKAGALISALVKAPVCDI